MAGLSILPADLHQGALLHKDLIKNTHKLHKSWHIAGNCNNNVVFKSRPAGDSQLNDCVKGKTGWCMADREGWQSINRNNAVIRVIPCQAAVDPVGHEHCIQCWPDATSSPETQSEGRAGRQWEKTMKEHYQKPQTVFFCLAIFMHLFVFRQLSSESGKWLL